MLLTKQCQCHQHWNFKLHVIIQAVVMGVASLFYCLTLHLQKFSLYYTQKLYGCRYAFLVPVFCNITDQVFWPFLIQNCYNQHGHRVLGLPFVLNVCLTYLSPFIFHMWYTQLSYTLYPWMHFKDARFQVFAAVWLRYPCLWGITLCHSNFQGPVAQWHVVLSQKNGNLTDFLQTFVLSFVH